jgi:hypothetical protein
MRMQRNPGRVCHAENTVMKRYRLLPSLLIFVCLSFSCNKPHETDNEVICTYPVSSCFLLMGYLINNDSEAVKSQITSMIGQLPSRQYTSENLDKLVEAISGSCRIPARVQCFNCIKTLPPQSEIVITLSNPSVEKIIDISSTPSNEMKFVNMHE